MVINKLLTKINFTDCNDTSRIKYIVIHYVGALGGAKANCEYYASTYIGASAHYYVGFEGEIWQSVADEDIAWSVGASSYVHKYARNSNTLNIEMCVRKKSTKTMNATDKDWYFEEATVVSTIELTKMLMQKYNIPESNVIRHYDVTGKICPNPYVYNNTTYTWDKFKKSLTGNSTIIDFEQYYVGTEPWNTTKQRPSNQIGAYSIKDNAINACIPGYSVFDRKGNIIYTVKATGTQATSFANYTEEQAAAKILELARADGKKSGICISVQAAQMILESGYVKTDLAVKANNCFGMKTELSGNTWKGSTWDGKSEFVKITNEEYTPGVISKVTAAFRKYPNIEDSLADHSAYLLGAMNGSELRYKGLQGCKDYKKAITIIKNGGYATDSQYINKICDIITRFKLDKYDSETLTDKKETAPVQTLKYKVGTYVNCSSYYKGKNDSISKAIYGSLHGTITKTDATAKQPYCIDDKYWVNDGDIRSTGKAFTPYMVHISSPNVYIRSEPKIANGNQKGFTGICSVTIVDEKVADGYTWGLLKAYEKNRNGWIAVSLDCIKKIKTA